METQQLHPNELSPIEAHHQTAHKLDVSNRYMGSYLSIIALARRRAGVSTAHIWIVDAFAGAGLHLSANHPQGVIPGTALQATFAANQVQRKHPHMRVHVRLIELNPGYCERLRERVQRFADASGNERVDVQVVEGSFETRSLEVLDEIRQTGGGQHALWFIDPYNLVPIEKRTLDPIVRARNSEMIVNLDSGALNRMFNLVQKRAVGWVGNATRLTSIFGSDAWKLAVDRYKAPGNKPWDAFAQCYAKSIKGFPFAKPYALRMSDSQFRHLVHFARVPAAVQALDKAYAASQRTGLLKGRMMTDADRYSCCSELHKRFRGTPSTLKELYEAQIVPLDLGQLGVVLRYAHVHDFGEFDETSRTIVWKPEAPRAFKKPSAPREHDSPQTDLFDQIVES